jgi:hypothetical protein
MSKNKINSRKTQLVSANNGGAPTSYGKNPRHIGTWTAWYMDISVLGTGHFGTDLDISVLDTGQFGTWMRQYSVLTTIVWYLLIGNIFVLVVL